MNYASQTGQVFINSKDQQSTAGNAETFSGVVFCVPQKVIFKQTSRGIHSGLELNSNDEKLREELTQEEEDRFYKKVLKTSLI